MCAHVCARMCVRAPAVSQAVRSGVRGSVPLSQEGLRRDGGDVVPGQSRAWAAQTEGAEAVSLLLHLRQGFAVPQHCPDSCAGPRVPGFRAHHPRGSAAWERQHLLQMPPCCVGNPVSQPGKPLHLRFQEFKNSWHPPCTWCGRRGSPAAGMGTQVPTLHPSL